MKTPFPVPVQAPTNAAVPAASGPTNANRVKLDLHFVDELIGQRKVQHGGGRGAPKIVVEAGVRQGASINRSCIVLLSAQLQSFVEQVFEVCAKEALPSLKTAGAYEKYWTQIDGKWGNPNPGNINRLFLRIGVVDVLSDLSWQKTPAQNVVVKLDRLNQVRNRIAHGSKTIMVDKKAFSLSLAAVVVLRNFTEAFAERFEAHALAKIASR